MKTSAVGRSKFKKTSYLIFAVFTILVLVLAFALKPSSQKSQSLEVPGEIFKNEDFAAFEDFANEVGAKKAYLALKSYFKNNDAKAHDFAHVIGFAAVSEEDINGIKICDNFYNYGCFHGFMQVYLRNHGISAVSDMEKACTDLGTVNAPSCLHGIGHGLMMEASYDLYNALQNCQILQDSYQTYCFDGVFMERIAGSMLADDKKLVLTKENLLEPCGSMSPKFKRECWRNQVSVWYTFFKGDSASVGTYCSSIEDQYWETCFEGMGYINVITIGEDIENLVKSCNVVNDRAHDLCLMGEVKELLFEGKSPQIAESICFSSTVQSRDRCLATFSQAFSDYKERFNIN